MKIGFKENALQIERGVKDISGETSFEARLASFMVKIDERLKQHAEGEQVADFGMSFETSKVLVNERGIEKGEIVLDEAQTYYFLDAQGVPCLNSKMFTDLFYQYYEEMIGESENPSKYNHLNPDYLRLTISFYDKDIKGGFLKRFFIKETVNAYASSFELFKDTFDKLTGVMVGLKVEENVEA